MAAADGARCPNDDGYLHQVAAHTRLGAAVLVDQCDRCGGIWFDRFELFQLDEKDAAGLDPVDEQSLRDPQGAHEQPLCPKCSQPLTTFHDANIPISIQMLYCGACEGFWLNHGALTGYAGFREQRHPAPDPKLAQEYAKMLAATSDADKWNSIAGMGNELGGRRDPLTMLPLDGTPEQLDKIDMAQNAAFAVIRTVARLVFGI